MNWHKDLIIIKDNFFEETLFKKIQAELDTSKFKSTKPDETYKQIYFKAPIVKDHPAALVIKSFFKAEFGIIITAMESFYLLSPKHEKPSPHSDRIKINCPIYLKGGSLMNNGTALYEKDGENWVINSHIGFKENRAVMFSSERTHASLQFAEGATGRFIMGNFIEDYELE